MAVCGTQKQPSFFPHLIVLVMCKLPEGKVYRGSKPWWGVSTLTWEHISQNRNCFIYLFFLVKYSFGLPRWLSRKNPLAQCRSCRCPRFSGLGSFPGVEMATHSRGYACLGTPMDRRAWGVGSWSSPELDTTERLNMCIVVLQCWANLCFTWGRHWVILLGRFYTELFYKTSLLFEWNRLEGKLCFDNNWLDFSFLYMSYGV